VLRSDPEFPLHQALTDLQSVWFEQPQPAQDAVANFSQSIFGPLIDRLGFEFDKEDSPDLISLRSLAFASAGAAGYAPVVEFAKNAFRTGVIPPDLAASIYTLVSIIYMLANIISHSPLLSPTRRSSFTEENASTRRWLISSPTLPILREFFAYLFCHRSQHFFK